MEFVIERKGYRENDDEEEEEDDEDEDEGEEIGSSISKFPFSSASSSSSKAYSDYSKRQLIGDQCEEFATRSYIQLEARTIVDSRDGDGGGGGWRRERDRERELGEREHMFDKVVTPSDVGKLNRLVIPKQHAEKYFPLHSSGSEKSGALLDFEDRNGKQWRFRYSYWNSSQSYVMTKGWSRFVKEKKLDAGDIVSFHRSISAAGGDDQELGGPYKDKYRLFIDWRHRSPIQHVPVPVHVPVPPPPPHGAWGYNHNHHLTQLMNYNHFQPYSDHHHRHDRHRYGPQRSVDHYSGAHHEYMKNMGAPAAGSIYYLTPSEPRLIMGKHDQTVINSVPVLHPMNPPPLSSASASASASPKRLRLFGVNMEEYCCPIQTDHEPSEAHHHQHVLPSVPYYTMPSTSLLSSTNVSHLPKASTSYLPTPLSSSTTATTPQPPTTLPKSRNTTSLTFDLHLSDSH